MGASKSFFVVVVFSVLAFTSQIKAKQVSDQSENEAEINTDVPEEKNVSIENNAKEDAPSAHIEEKNDETESDYKTKLDPTEDKQILKRASGKLADDGDAAGLVVNVRKNKETLKNKDESKSSEILSETDIAKKSSNVLANDNNADIVSDKKETETATLIDEIFESDKEEEMIAHSETTPEADSKEDSDNIDTHLKDNTPLDDNKDESKVEEESDPVDSTSVDFVQSRRTLSAVPSEIVESKPKSDVLKTPGTVGAEFNLPGSRRSYQNEINIPRLLFQPAASIMYEYHRPVNTPAPLLNRFTATDIVTTTPFKYRFSSPDVINSSPPLINKFSSPEVINSTPRNTKRLTITEGVNSAPILTRFPIQEPVNPAPMSNSFAVQKVTNPTLLYNRFPAQEVTNPTLLYNRFPVQEVTNPTLLYNRFPVQEVTNPTLIFNRFLNSNSIPEGVNSNSFLQRHPPEYPESREQNHLWSERTTNSYQFSPTTTQNLDMNRSPFDIFSKLAQASENTGPQNHHGNFYKPFEPNYNIHNYNPFIS